MLSKRTAAALLGSSIGASIPRRSIASLSFRKRSRTHPHEIRSLSRHTFFVVVATIGLVVFTPAVAADVGPARSKETDEELEMADNEMRDVDTNVLLGRPKAYKYNPLYGNDTRILTILPCGPDDDAPLRASLNNVPSIREYPEEYTAISYAWDEDKDLGARHILIDGMALDIGPNAYNALKHLRSANREVHIWIDGVCIDQTNERERAMVVKRMKDIYATAAAVVVWLGLPKKDASFFTAYEKWKRMRVLNTAQALPILERVWFTRKWVLQEAVLAKVGQLEVRCGHLMAMWDGRDGFGAFMSSVEVERAVERHARAIAEQERKTAIGCESSVDEAHVQAMNIQRAIKTVQYIQNARTRQTPVSLFHLLMQTTYTDVKKIPDHVAALLGLAEDWSPNCGLSPAYMDTDDVDKHAAKKREFVNFATWDVSRNLFIRVLANASGPCSSNLSRSAACLPSWVPDWTERDKPEPLSREYTRFPSLPEKKPTRDCRSPKPITLKTSQDGKISLGVLGEFIDEIDTCGPATPEKFKLGGWPGVRNRKGREEVGAWLAECRNLAKKAYGVRYLENLADAFTFGYREVRSLSSARFTRDELRAIQERERNLYRMYFALYLHENLPSSAHSFGSVPDPEIADQLRHTYSDPIPPDHFKPRIEVTLGRWGVGRRLCITRDGRLGFVPKDASPGDLICILQGYDVPYVVRRRGEAFEAVGECYVVGVNLLLSKWEIKQATDGDGNTRYLRPWQASQSIKFI